MTQPTNTSRECADLLETLAQHRHFLRHTAAGHAAGFAMGPDETLDALVAGGHALEPAPRDRAHRRRDVPARRARRHHPRGDRRPADDGLRMPAPP